MKFRAHCSARSYSKDDGMIEARAIFDSLTRLYQKRQTIHLTGEVGRYLFVTSSARLTIQTATTVPLRQYHVLMISAKYHWLGNAAKSIGGATGKNKVKSTPNCLFGEPRTT